LALALPLTKRLRREALTLRVCLLWALMALVSMLGWPWSCVAALLGAEPLDLSGWRG
jgi:hypothetical protein